MLDIKDVKKARISLGLTQIQLAREAGVSQSVIAKIESDRIDPSYSIAQRIFAALEQRRMSNAPKAIDVMHSSVIAVHPDTRVSEAVKLMRQHGISQLPVQDSRIVGLITESTILKHLDAVNAPVSNIMEAAPPIVPPAADLLVISNLLQFYPLVLVVEKGVLVGIITKADVLNALV